MTIVTKNDLVQSVADALQFISYYHPADYIRALGRAYQREQSPAAKDAIAQILTNSRMCAEGHRPICQDLGMEAIYEFEVQDMPVTVAVDANGTSVHNTGPAEWSRKIVELKLPVTAA